MDCLWKAFILYSLSKINLQGFSHSNFKLRCSPRFCSPSLIRPVNEDSYHNTFISEYWSCCWTCRRVFLLLINANQFRALMLNRDQYPGAADEIWFQLVSLPAEVFNHKVNQDLGDKSDEIAHPMQDPSAAGPGGGNFGRISRLLLGRADPALWSRFLVEARAAPHTTQWIHAGTAALLGPLSIVICMPHESHFMRLRSIKIQ